MLTFGWHRPASVQAVHIGLDRVEAGVVVLSGGQHRAVLEITRSDAGGDSDRQPETRLATVAALLNSLPGPVQILVQSLDVDLETYLAALERRACCELPATMALLAREHAGDVRRLARQSFLPAHRMYLVVPAGEVLPHRVRWWPFGSHAADGTRLEPDAIRRQLSFRCEELVRRLVPCGLAARRLADAELEALYYACWCPELARVQRHATALPATVLPVVQPAAKLERSG